MGEGVMCVEISGEVFELLPQKAMFWTKSKVLLLSDLHLGKISHFRRSGIPLPTKANDKNIETLIDLLYATKPERIIFLGDLFHSHYNPEWEVFGELVKYFKNLSFELVLGNHDIMSKMQYARKGIKLHEHLIINNFIFTHHPLAFINGGFYNLAGHIHPGVHLQGRGRQGLTLPCFYFGGSQGLLPAFGVFTGLSLIKPKKEDKVYVIAEERIINMSCT